MSVIDVVSEDAAASVALYLAAYGRIADSYHTAAAVARDAERVGNLQQAVEHWSAAAAYAMAAGELCIGPINRDHDWAVDWFRRGREATVNSRGFQEQLQRKPNRPRK